jgi:hypothetical protein
MKKIYLLTTGLCLSVFLMAQSPGGISAGLSLWLRADAAGTLNLTGSNVNSWKYFNNGLNSFSFTAGTNGTLVPAAVNGLPAVNFGGNTEMDGPTGANAPLAANSVAYTAFAVWNSSITGTNAGPFQRIWTQWGNNSIDGNGTSVWLYNGEWGDQPEISVGGFITGEGRAYSTGTYYITQMNLLNQASNDLELVDQNNLATGPTVLSTEAGSGNTVRANLSNAINSLGYRQGSPAGEFFNGNLAELIVYGNSISAGASRNQIFSYLSMKYGIPVGVSLLSSAGATVWDATAQAGAYNNSVFGLAMDNGSGLNVQSSQASTTAGVNDAANILLTPFDPLSTDQTFLMVGNDNGALTEEITDMPAYAAGSSRLIRNWFVQNAGTGGAVGRVNLGVDLTGVPISGSLSTPTDFRLMVNNSGDNTFATTDGLYTPTSILGNVVNFTGANLPNGSVFAFITNASGATPLPVNFISFTAQPNSGNVDLNWVVGDNAQASSYEVDRSSDGVNFTKIAVLPNNADQTNYSFVDANAGGGTHYYRVLETDQDGKSIYSKVVSATIAGGDFSVAVLNNPAVGKTDAQLQINAVSPGVAYIELWSVGGSRLSLQQQAIGTGTTTISVPMSNLAPGSYVVKVMVDKNTHVAQVVKM